MIDDWVGWRVICDVKNGCRHPPNRTQSFDPVDGCNDYGLLRANGDDEMSETPDDDFVNASVTLQLQCQHLAVLTIAATDHGISDADFRETYGEQITLLIELIDGFRRITETTVDQNEEIICNDARASDVVVLKFSDHGTPVELADSTAHACGHAFIVECERVLSGWKRRLHKLKQTDRSTDRLWRQIRDIFCDLWTPHPHNLSRLIARLERERALVNQTGHRKLAQKKNVNVLRQVRPEVRQRAKQAVAKLGTDVPRKQLLDEIGRYRKQDKILALNDVLSDLKESKSP